MVSPCGVPSSPLMASFVKQSSGNNWSLAEAQIVLYRYKPKKHTVPSGQYPGPRLSSAVVVG